MLDRDEAEHKAAKFLTEASKAWGPSGNVRIIKEYCFTDQGHFVAPYDHVDYLDHGREDMQLGGNLPVAVDLNTGSCRFITRAETEDFMERDLL
ncbi:hypothetical protein [Streptomyces sp. HB2AG]|uniref:hypothetical protein n=1 Tax=Streptomyces sp. HB2AG TaxID=2983400 RepID=UPI0022AA3419|nr:hypothetical protein [Streptomyces sp. HB2AG]MCZ2525739.1 hypothetical protein [Streptomyces sp. HB2AG]